MYVSGMGAVCRNCPKGMGTIDLSTLSWEDYLLVGIGGAIFVSLLMEGRPKRSRRKKGTASGGSQLNWAIGLPLVGIAAYVGYLYFTQTGAVA